jgi:hypothetical protein
MAYIVRKMAEQQVAPGVVESYAEETDVVYVETVAEAQHYAATVKQWPESLTVVTLIDDDMSEDQADRAQELYPGQTADQGAVADIPDEMYGAAQTKVYG